LRPKKPVLQMRCRHGVLRSEPCDDCWIAACLVANRQWTSLVYGVLVGGSIHQNPVASDRVHDAGHRSPWVPRNEDRSYLGSYPRTGKSHPHLDPREEIELIPKPTSLYPRVLKPSGRASNPSRRCVPRGQCVRSRPRQVPVQGPAAAGHRDRHKEPV